MEAHDSRCEREYTENGFIFIDCLCHIRRAKADAWDEGHEVCEWSGCLRNHVNPYRD